MAIRRNRRDRAGPSRIPRRWRSAGLAALTELVARIGRGRRVHAIGLTGQCPSLVVVDRSDRPLGPGLIYRDNRAAAEAAWIRDRLGDAEIHRRTGHLPAAFHVAPKLLWLQRERPATWDGVTLALQPRDWLALALTGERATDGTHAAATLVQDLATRAGRRTCWRRSVCPRRSCRRSLARRRSSGASAPRLPADRAAERHAGRHRRCRQPGLRPRRRRSRLRSGQRDGRVVDLPQCRRPGAARDPRSHALPARRRAAASRPRRA